MARQTEPFVTPGQASKISPFPPAELLYVGSVCAGVFLKQVLRACQAMLFQRQLSDFHVGEIKVALQQLNIGLGQITRLLFSCTSLLGFTPSRFSRDPGSAFPIQ